MNFNPGPTLNSLFEGRYLFDRIWERHVLIWQALEIIINAGGMKFFLVRTYLIKILKSLDIQIIFM